MSSSTDTDYNEKRRKYRKGRGEDTNGSPGDKATTDGYSIGPPLGHTGVSHSNTPSCTLKYNLGTDRCYICGHKMKRQAPIRKMITDMDRYMRPVSAMAVIQNACCTHCGATVKARTPFLEGTSLGPVMLSMILWMSGKACTDKTIAEFFYEFYRFKMATNTVTAARRAIAAFLKDKVIRTIMEKIKGMPWIQIDETMFKRGDGKWGYVWVVYTSEAAFVLFSPTRAGAVLDIHFDWIRGKVALADGYKAYKSFFKRLQRCIRHLLAETEKLAILQPGTYEAAYDIHLKFYRRIKKIKTLAPLTMMGLSREAYTIACMFDKRVKTLLINAIPNMFTFLSVPGMPPHNNDAESLIRNGVVPHRRVRHKIVTPEGREVFSINTTFTQTCRLQKASPARALLEYMLNENWDLFRDAANTPASLVNDDGTRYSIFDIPGPPPAVPAAPRSRTAVMPATA